MTGAISEKVSYVKAQGQTREHHCHWPGCTRQVPPAVWGCKPHWYALPRELRDWIWRTYKPGQEVRGTPSTSYLAAARAAQDWIKANAQATPQMSAALPVADGMATLIDGRQVSSASEEWRHECEARHVASMPLEIDRQAYIEAVMQRRGAAAGTALAVLTRRLLASQRGARAKTAPE